MRARGREPRAIRTTSPPIPAAKIREDSSARSRASSSSWDSSATLACRAATWFSSCRMRRMPSRDTPCWESTWICCSFSMSRWE
ncbi:hypothetical protein BJF77_05135 [Kocuria sp. CNJ-770]|nr:hypothetical protein BJF77_05135 [Kocuria sp. CNJ-770]